MSNKIGVFVCHCGINIASMIDVKKLVEYAKKLDGVAVSKDYKYMCSDVGANLIKDSIKKDKLDVLKHKGRQVLCRDCMGEKLQAGGKSKEIPTTPKSGFSKSLWKLIGRTVNVYSS